MYKDKCLQCALVSAFWLTYLNTVHRLLKCLHIIIRAHKNPYKKRSFDTQDIKQSCRDMFLGALISFVVLEFIHKICIFIFDKDNLSDGQKNLFKKRPCCNFHYYI